MTQTHTHTQILYSRSQDLDTGYRTRPRMHLSWCLKLIDRTFSFFSWHLSIITYCTRVWNVRRGEPLALSSKSHSTRMQRLDCGKWICAQTSCFVFLSQPQRPRCDGAVVTGLLYLFMTQTGKSGVSNLRYCRNPLCGGRIYSSHDSQHSKVWGTVVWVCAHFL